MARGAYRVEVSYPKYGKPKYYLVKDIVVKGQKRKATKYIRSGDPPSIEELEQFKRLHAYQLELTAAKKKAELSAKHYHSGLLGNDIITQLENLRFIYQRFGELLTVNEAEVYESNFEVHYISGTTKYEGNTLTLDQTKDLLLAGILPKDKTSREIYEVDNFKKVVRFRNTYKKKVNLDLIKGLHALVMDNIDIESAGTFRRTNDILIGGCSIDLTPAAVIEDELDQAISDYYSDIKNGVHPFESALIFHYRFETIHPFTDGNGRVGREVLNFMLMKEKFPRLLFLGKDRDRYIAALKMGNDGQYEEMVSSMAELILSQRMGILIQNLEKVIEPPMKSGQMRLTDF
jgi:Fic family protein